MQCDKNRSNLEGLYCGIVEKIANMQCDRNRSDLYPVSCGIVGKIMNMLGFGTTHAMLVNQLEDLLKSEAPKAGLDSQSVFWEALGKNTRDELLTLKSKAAEGLDLAMELALESSKPYLVTKAAEMISQELGGEETLKFATDQLGEISGKQVLEVLDAAPPDPIKSPVNLFNMLRKVMASKNTQEAVESVLSPAFSWMMELPEASTKVVAGVTILCATMTSKPLLIAVPVLCFILLIKLMRGICCSKAEPEVETSDEGTTDSVPEVEKNDEGTTDSAPEIETFPEGTTREKMLDTFFEALDKDKSGFLTLAEYEGMAESSDETAKAELKKNFDSMDKAGKGLSGKPKDHKLSLKEFAEGTLKSLEGDTDEEFAKKVGRWVWLAKNKK